MTFDPRNALHFGQGFFQPNLVAIGHFKAIWPLVDPEWPLHDLWPQQFIMLGSGVLPIKFGGHRALLSELTPNWPQLTPIWPLTPSNVLCSGQGFFLANLVAIGHCLANWPLFDPSWPLHDLWPQQCVTLWSDILTTKFGGHRAFLSNLTPGWPQVTPAWPLTPAMHYALVRGSSHQIW